MKQSVTFESEENRFLAEIKDLLDKPLEVEGFIETNYDSFFTNIPSGEYKKFILKRIYKNYLSSSVEKEPCQILLTEGDVKFLQSLPTDKLKRLFYCLKVRAQVNKHPSGWISLDLEKTLLYGFLESQARHIKIEELANCVPYGFEVRVSGSTKPVLCFKIPEYEGKVIFEFGEDVAREKFLEVIEYGDTD